ncbi:PREDICTED: putative defensin-like protein 20 [Camelina sativa]|uniref:Defensin-like protein 20 n=1 Tax=Camelina sativa TaxID=90675 RepID=A0ABM1QLT7_CAMSA|nr:PREDICTED: putative defensin-like protein 20 [Camelina sativa]
MLRTKMVSLVLFAAIVLCIVEGQKNIAPWVYNIKSICCREHPSLGRCLPGIDDKADNDGKCWKYCVEGCERGGFCKPFGNKHICHCYC